MRRLLGHLSIILLPSLMVQAGEWSLQRAYRRHIENAARDETVVFKYASGGHSGKPAVIDSNGKILASKILATTIGGDIWVAYQGSTAQGDVWVYYGAGTSQQARRGAWQPKFSLALMTTKLPAGGLDSAKAIAAAMRGRIYGMGFVDNIWHGYNPFGPDDNYASAYAGYLKIDKPGTYRVFTNSDEASFVFIDGSEVCSWPKRHSAKGRRGQHGADIHLSKGEHRIEYYHAEVDGVQVMSLGWVRPGDLKRTKGRKFHPVPKSAFLHTHVAKAGPVERKGNAPLAAFSHQQVDQLLHESYQYTRIRFKDGCRNVPDGARVIWNFSDGVKSEQRGGDHIYVSRKEFHRCSVRIVAKSDTTLDKFEALVPIEIPLRNLTIRNAGQVREYAQAILKTDMKQVPGEAMKAYWLLVESIDDPKLIEPFAEVFVERFGHRGDAWPVADRLAMALSIKEPKKAIELYGKLAKSARTQLDAARARMEQIELVLHRLKDTDRAMAMATAVRDGRSGLEQRIAIVKLGDVHRALGNFEEAEKNYRIAQRLAIKKMDRREVAVRQGGYLETIASLLDQGHVRAGRRALVRWECDYPTGKLSGDLILQTARYFSAIGDHHRALEELDTLVKINPFSPYLPEIELSMARAYAKLGNAAKARELRQKVIREYPKSPAAKAARNERF